MAAADCTCGLAARVALLEVAVQDLLDLAWRHSGGPGDMGNPVIVDSWRRVYAGGRHITEPIDIEESLAGLITVQGFDPGDERYQQRLLSIDDVGQRLDGPLLPGTRTELEHLAEWYREAGLRLGDHLQRLADSLVHHDPPTVDERPTVGEQ